MERDIQRIFGYSSLQINASPNDQTLQLFLNEHSFKLFDVEFGNHPVHYCSSERGDAKPSYILLDEPELGLHPSLQLDFLTTYWLRMPTVAFSSLRIAWGLRGRARSTWTIRKITEITSDVRPLGRHAVFDSSVS